MSSPDTPVPLRRRLALLGLDGTTLLIAPALLFLLAVFVYPFLYGLWLSFAPQWAIVSPNGAALVAVCEGAR